jgi:2-C-methyl-D-erythritol 4-phosphate cytidylyltransferase
VVPAAGIGSRLGAAIPKQYLTLAGKTVIEHSVQRLLDVPLLAGVVVALRADDRWWQELPISADTRVQACVGGAERADSVLAGLKQLQPVADADDWVLVHDAARPCVQTAQINLMFETLKHDPVGGIMAVPAADTVKKSDVAGQKILATVDRSQLWLAQTPQMFRLGQLNQAISDGLAANTITDEASAMEFSGFKPALFAGRSDNIKITSKQDLALAEFIISQQIHERTQVN